MPTILIVDDERPIRRTLREILEYEDYDIEEAEDGEQALAMLRKGRYDLALLDGKMPKVDGLDVLRTARDEGLDTPVIMLSGHGTIETAVEATRRGAFDFLEKPPDLNRLLVTIRNALDGFSGKIDHIIKPAGGGIHTQELGRMGNIFRVGRVRDERVGFVTP